MPYAGNGDYIDVNLYHNPKGYKDMDKPTEILEATTNDYVSVVYDEKKRPKTAYPLQLADHLCRRFNLASGTHLLDTGCGRGDFLEAFHQKGLRVSGIDGSDFAVQLLKQYDVRKADLDTGRFPFDDETFDVVFSKSVVEHFHNPEHFILETRRVLKKGGRIIAMTPDWVSQMPIFFDDYTHRTPFTCESLKDMLEIFGFKNVTSEKFYQLPVLWDHPSLVFVSRLLQLFVPVTLKPKNKFIRWSVELMLLGSGTKA
jgi:2-polyprenyl-3-methyl-5-hydroxy-6-metoxy-1,4-benzoquinol methylase